MTTATDRPAIELYTLPNTLTHCAAYHTATGQWELFPSVQGGYAQRREWTPSAFMAKTILNTRTAYGHQTHRADLMEVGHHARWLGLPESSTKSRFEKS